MVDANKNDKDNETKNETRNESVAFESGVRIVSLVFFSLFFFLDKVTQKIAPIPEIWYGAAAGVFVFGNKIFLIIKKLGK